MEEGHIVIMGQENASSYKEGDKKELKVWTSQTEARKMPDGNGSKHCASGSPVEWVLEVTDENSKAEQLGNQAGRFWFIFIAG